MYWLSFDQVGLLTSFTSVRRHFLLLMSYSMSCCPTIVSAAIERPSGDQRAVHSPREPGISLTLRLCTSTTWIESVPFVVSNTVETSPNAMVLPSGDHEGTPCSFLLGSKGCGSPPPSAGIR